MDILDVHNFSKTYYTEYGATVFLCRHQRLPGRKVNDGIQTVFCPAVQQGFLTDERFTAGIGFGQLAVGLLLDTGI